MTGSHPDRSIRVDAARDGPGTADVDAGDLGPQLCAGSALCVFVTSTAYDGNLGGVAGADAKCQSHASAAGLGGTFRAWIADATLAPRTSFTNVDGALPYVLPNGQVIATSWADLTDKNLLAPIDRDEMGRQVSDEVWSNVTWAGAAQATTTGHCQNWTLSGHGDLEWLAWRGDTTATNQDWTTTGTNWCDTPSRLYCFKQ